MVRRGFAWLESDFGARPAAALRLGEDGLEHTRCDVTIPAALGVSESDRGGEATGLLGRFDACVRVGRRGMRRVVCGLGGTVEGLPKGEGGREGTRGVGGI